MSNRISDRVSSAHSTPPAGRVVVLKFGSSVLPSEQQLHVAIREIQHRLDEGARVVAVVSALGSTTDDLLEHATAGGPAEPEALAAFLATGEARATSLLGLALHRAGIPAHVLDSAGIGLRTHGPVLDADAFLLDSTNIRKALNSRPVLVVPGFVGRDELGRITLLGRGGSDLTALFIAAELGAECVLLKDVDGLYDRDPNEHADARRYERVSFDAVLALDEGIVQHKAVRFARWRRLPFVVTRVGATRSTLVHAGDTVQAPLGERPAPARTAEAVA
ncbi:MAG: hypothetical protein SFY96_13200 [Planctomycetota bacterium]|nr:hypothetical protein [Planctomycetota bacterium]